MLQFHNFASVAILATLSLALTGCGARTDEAADDQVNRPPVSIDELEHDHEHHAHAESYGEAVAEIDSMRTQIRDGFAANDIEAADGPIHEIGHVLEEVVELAEKENFSDDVIAEISAAVETLFDAFGRVDEKIHGGQGADYADVESEVDSAIGTLQKHTQAAAPAGETEQP